MGLVLPKPGFLEGLRAIADQHGSLLIFDEVITGFRAAFGGAQARFNINPDLTTFGKIIGGGLPVGAFGGKRKYMLSILVIGNAESRILGKFMLTPRGYAQKQGSGLSTHQNSWNNISA